MPAAAGGLLRIASAGCHRRTAFGLALAAVACRGTRLPQCDIRGADDGLDPCGHRLVPLNRFTSVRLDRDRSNPAARVVAVTKA
jgi:hypothetical protein